MSEIPASRGVSPSPPLHAGAVVGVVVGFLEIVKKATLGLRLACGELAAQQGGERAVVIGPIPEGGARPLLIGLAQQGVRAVERRWASLPPGPRARGAQP